MIGRSACGLVVLLACSQVADVRGQDPEGWSLVWSDEFDGTNGSPPDAAKWGRDIGGSGWGNNELQYYTNRTDNARIEDGKLVIEAKAENFGGRNYTSARLLTKGKASWTYGRMEARIKIPKGKGIWPAFWMLGNGIDTAGWPLCGEIDIMENIGSFPSTVHGTVHGPGYSGGNGISRSYVLPGAELSDDFHIYAIEWDENRIRWYFDGQAYSTLVPQDLPNGASWVFNQPQFIILNVAVGGNWPGSPDGSTVFPQRMTVDYVRVFSREADNGSNLLANPGFESGSLAGWTTFGGNTHLEDDIVRGGGGSFKVFGQFSGVANDSGIYQDVPAVAGEAYLAETWVHTPGNDKIAGANSAYAEVSFLDSQGEILSRYRSETTTAASPADIWQKIVVATRIDPDDGSVLGTVSELVAPAGTAVARMRLVFHQQANAAGSVRFDDSRFTQVEVEEPPAAVDLTVDPPAQWRGYANVFDLPADGGAFRFGSVWETADLKATFAGPVLSFFPNTNPDPSPYWYVGGGAPGSPGNKVVEANMYVESNGPLSGKSLTFSGHVAANSLTPAHPAVAFIKDFSPDYSSVNTVTVPLSSGPFTVKLDTDSGAGRHVQYGFRLVGPNIWATDAAPFGSVQITAKLPDPFADWIAAFDFSGFAAPDLSPLGDPDQDGRSNLMEFALNEDPSSGASSGNVRSRVEDAGNPVLVLTLPVRDGAVFGGSPGKTAVIGPVAYHIEGSGALVDFDREVVEMPAATDALPELDEGWSYRSFKLDNASGATGSSGPAGFLRVRVSAVP